MHSVLMRRLTPRKKSRVGGAAVRAEGLVQRDELAAHAPAGDAVCVEVGVDVD